MIPLVFMPGSCYPRLQPTRSDSVSGTAANDPGLIVDVTLSTVNGALGHRLLKHTNGLALSATSETTYPGWLPGGARSGNETPTSACESSMWSVRMVSANAVANINRSEQLSTWYQLGDFGGGGGGPWGWEWQRTTAGSTVVTATLQIARSSNLSQILAQTVFTLTITAT